eukprot:4918981-Amphidinium_carterae.2
MTILSKYLEADGKTIKQQYVAADDGVEHNHNQDRYGSTPLAQRQSHGLEQSEDGNPRQQQWQWNRLA